MKIEVLKKSKVKRNIVIVLIAVLIITAIVLQFTRARYRATDTVSLVSGEVNYKVPDLNMVSLYVANEEGTYEESDIIPTSGYTLNTEQSYCGRSNNGEIVKDESVILTYKNGSIRVDNITKKGTKCYLYFNVKKVTSGESIIANYPAKLVRNNFSAIVDDTTTGTIYYADTSNGRTYYFAGNPTDNWVQFAEFYWRIIRVNEDGSVRMIYQGTSANSVGSETQLQSTAFNYTYGDNTYAGYMMGLDNQCSTGQCKGTTNTISYRESTINTYNSTIKEILDQWYEDNLQDNYAQYLSKEAGFCGDREPSTSSSSSDSLGGAGTTRTYYGAYIRLITNKTPTFECQNENDLYTAKNANVGNKALNYPIGLITADEVAYAGATYNSNNTRYYLNTSQNFWTMSPSHYSDGARVFMAGSNGNFGLNDVYRVWGVRPVINLSSDVSITGSGTASDPYIVS